MRIRGLVLCAAVLASGVTSASATMRIAEDRGGQIGRYLQAFAMLRSTGERVVIDGNCLSACTLVLGLVPRAKMDAEPLLRSIGPEPLGNEFDARMLAQSCANKKTSLKAALLDQRVVAGLGNIYVCEALYRSHLSPRRLAATLATKAGRRKGATGGEPTDHAKRLVTAIHAVLHQAIKAGGSSLRDHRQTSGELGYFQHSFGVYDREGEKCQTAGCGGIVKRFTQNGRSTFWCPKCQN